MVTSRFARPAADRDRGFSLVELLVAMTISILVVGGAAMLGGQVQLLPVDGILDEFLGPVGMRRVLWNGQQPCSQDGL